MNKTTLLNRLTDHAHAKNIPATLAHAMAEHESGLDLYAYRVEPPYRYLVDMRTGRPFRTLTGAENRSERAPDDFPYDWHVSSRDTEWWGQQASWGVLQLMGAVARELGFRGRFPHLCDADVGLTYALSHLNALKQRFLEKHGWRGVVAAYNAGSPRYDDAGAFVNQSYVDAIEKLGGFDFPAAEERHA